MYGDWGGTDEEICQKARDFLDANTPRIGFRVCGECVDFPPEVTVSLGDFELQDDGQGFICFGNVQSWVAPAGKWPSGEEFQEMRALWGYDDGLDWIANLAGDYVLTKVPGDDVAIGEYANPRPASVRLNYSMNCDGCGVLRLDAESFGASHVQMTVLWDFCNGHDDLAPPLPPAEQGITFMSVPNDDRRNAIGARVACTEYAGETHTKVHSLKTGGNVLIRITGNFWYAPTGYFIGSATVSR